MIRTRFAPSPTGDPHIGNIRTALFAFLFARHNRGEFLLRIEDTDQKRHDEASIETIKEALLWLKIMPDNFDAPMVQSKRLDVYKKAALKLVDDGFAYVCNCSKERLDEIRKSQMEKGLPPGYDGHCKNKNLPFESNCVIRMRVPETGLTQFDDLIRGHVEFRNDTIDDQVILKSDGFPTYHLAHVVDDEAMSITHVIRSEEWLPSTPKHIILNQALGFPIPQYAHVPVILGTDKGKLSKRHGATGILEYRKEGYLWQAMVNFMVLLGWNPKTQQEVFDQKDVIYDELFELFDLASINKSPAVFDLDKLNHFNRHYLQKTPAEDLIPVLDDDVIAKLPKDNLVKIVEMAKDRMTVLSDFKKTVDFILTEPKLDKNLLVFRKSTPETTKKALNLVEAEFESISDWTAERIKAALESVVSKNSFSNGDVFWPVRYALSGAEKSPPPEEIAEILTKNESLKRIAAAKELL
jgi:glutamyl-tRNA synthetase